MILPYVQQNGAWSLNDTFMKSVFLKMQKHKLDTTVFYDGHVTHPSDFVMFAKRPQNVFNIHYDQERGCTGIAWMNDIGINSAFGHFCCFPEIWGGEGVIAMKENVDYWFDMKLDDKPILDVIMGRVPLWNKRAIKFVEKMGFEKIGTVAQIKLTKTHEPGMVLFYKAR